MKILRIAVLTALAFGACNNNAEPAAPSTKSVDSAAAAAPDTIKPIALDPVKR